MQTENLPNNSHKQFCYFEYLSNYSSVPNKCGVQIVEEGGALTKVSSINKQGSLNSKRVRQSILI